MFNGKISAWAPFTNMRRILNLEYMLDFENKWCLGTKRQSRLINGKESPWW